MDREALRTSFDRKAELYDAARPSYPPALVAAALAHVPANGRLLEIGAGTGKATRLFANRGHAITALEPGANLAALLRRNVAEATVVESTFEAYAGDGDFDLVYAAQAIHWVAPELRYVKSAALLRAGGAVAVIRNERAAMERADLDAAYARWFPEESADPTFSDAVAAEIAAEIAATQRFEPPQVTLYPWTTTYTTARYLDLLDTYSDHAVLPAGTRAGLYAAIANAIDQRGRSIEIPYIALLVLARR